MQTAHHPEARFRSPDELIAHYKEVNERIRTAGVRQTERERAREAAEVCVREEAARAALTRAAEQAVAIHRARMATSGLDVLKRRLRHIPEGRDAVIEAMKAVASDHGIAVGVILRDTSNIRAITMARKDAMRRVRAATPDTVSIGAIGRFFDRDHTTVLFALGRVKK